jgi:hypothetical protein
LAIAGEVAATNQNHNPLAAILHGILDEMRHSHGSSAFIVPHSNTTGAD